MMMTQNGKLLYISDNAAEYLGHSMEDLLIHGDSVYDIIDKQDHQAIQGELGRSPHSQSATHGGTLPPHGAHSMTDGEHRMFLCRMNVSRNARRQMRFGDQKVVLVQGHYLSFLPLCSRNEPVFLATCTPIAMPETRECVVQGATNVFTTIHSMDMKIMHIDKNGEFHLGFSRSELQGASWYQLLHWDYTREAQTKHRLITQSEQDRSCILLVRLQRRPGDWLWVHSVLQVKDSADSSQQPVIVCTNQVLSEREASVMRLNSWLYHYYSVQSKLQYGLTFEASRMPPTPAAPYYHSPLQPPAMSPYPQHPHPSYIHHQLSPAPSHPHIQHGQHLNGSGPTHHYLASLGTPESPGLIGGNILHNSNGTYTTYRIEAEPVDYSVNPDVHLLEEHRRSSISSPPSKRKMLNHHSITTKMEPLYISSSMSPTTELVDLDQGGRDEGGGTVLLPASLPRPRLLVKAPLLQDPAEFIEQWNPSPPWSDGALQKVPDLTHQELSPYLTTTPPTPTSAPHPHIQQAFSFDWIPEQFVPNMPCCNRQNQDESCHIHEGMWATEHRLNGNTTLAWPAEHRLFPLQPPPPPRITPVRADPEVDQPLSITDLRETSS